MRNYFRLFLVLSLLASPTFIYANNTAEKQVVVETVQKQGEAAYQNWIKAINSHDVAKIVALYKSDAILLATLKNEPITDQKDRNDYFTSLTQKPELKAEPQKTLIQPFGNQVIVVSGLYEFSFKKDGAVVKVPARFSFIFEKGADGKWLIANHHSSKLPIE